MSTASSGSQSTATAAAPRPVRVYRLRFSRDWITRSGPKRQRRTVLVFVLRKAALVEFVVIQVSPYCRRVGRFRVRGHRGVNRVRFRGRVGRTVLGPGTYRIQARVGRQRVIDTRLVIVRHPSGNEIAAARRADVCGSAPEPEGSSSAGSGAAGAAGGDGRKPGSTRSGAGAEDRTSRDKDALGVKFARDAIQIVKHIPWWLYVLLGVAIGLLAVAALPLRATPHPEFAFLLARRRSAIAIAGAATLLVATVTYLLI